MWQSSAITIMSSATDWHLIFLGKIPWAGFQSTPPPPTPVDITAAKIVAFPCHQCDLKISHFNATSSAYCPIPPRAVETFGWVSLNISQESVHPIRRRRIEEGILLELNVKTTSCFFLKIWVKYSKKCEPSIKVSENILNLLAVVRGENLKIFREKSASWQMAPKAIRELKNPASPLLLLCTVGNARSVWRTCSILKFCHIWGWFPREKWKENKIPQPNLSEVSQSCT